MTPNIYYESAAELARRIRNRELSVVEVVEAHLRRIEAVNPAVNAIVTLTAERALAAAQVADATLAQGQQPGLLCGLPVAHKDLVETKGIRTTYGSPIFADHVPDFDALIVERLRAAGAITIGKTNTPEFGAGSQTFNAVFGATRNPYDLNKTCGGSSGGAAVALACGMVPLADGSDLGGSLRNPAGYCNVVGFRTSPGRVPTWPSATPFLPFAVDGPMARSVEDVALMLAAIVGPDVRAPLSISEPGSIFLPPLDRDLRGLRIAWSADLGELPLDPQVRAIVDARRADFEAMGCIVEEASPDLRDADEVFTVMRAFSYALTKSELLAQHGDKLKDTVIWNIEAGQRLSGPQVGRAMRLHGELYQRVRAFMERYDALVTAVSQVPPFAIEQPYVTEIAGVAMHNYIEWMRSCYYITVTGLPAIAVPAGFTASGLPVGLQIVGRYRAERAVLELAYGYEQATGFGRRRPHV
ncbi:amidase [Candidatus Gracilibacteria bacterium]|nr:amidase [Candidatus Gracilibacteria bacterium]